MRVLNLGCGTKTSAHPDVINIDWTVQLRIRRNPFLKRIAPFILTKERYNRFNALPNNVLVHNLAKGIPFGNNSADLIYHSHLLEHLDRPIAEKFLLEVKRVLKPGGIHRIAVPDLEMACRDYMAHIALCEKNENEIGRHDHYIEPIIEQSVRREAYATEHLPPLRRIIESRLGGDARQRGETHQWMYDRFNLRALLARLGYRNITVQSYQTSLCPTWATYGLDVDAQGNQYKTDSLYIEAIK